MLSRHDDFPIHQTPEPLAQPATSDRNFYDRYWFNGFARDGEFAFGVALAEYPNRRIIDAAFSLVRDGEQHSLHASQRASTDRSSTQVGPLTIEVLEPMRRIRVRVAPNATGIECDLEFVARTATIEEGRATMRHEGRVTLDSTRFNQFGTWSGSAVAAGKRTQVDAERVLGVRDRSWGVRPVGEPETGGAPPITLPQIFFLWAPLHFDDICTHAGLFERSDGTRWHQDGFIVPTYESIADLPGIEDPRTEHATAIEHQIDYVQGTRRARAAKLELTRKNAAPLLIELEPLLRFQMLGLGYMHPEWGHGFWKGESALGAVSLKLAELDPLAPQHQHIQQVVRARCGDREGVGLLEQLCIGTYPRYGFTDLLGGAA